MSKYLLYKAKEQFIKSLDKIRQLKLDTKVF